jgi:ABC-2 type transport system permease protein
VINKEVRALLPAWVVCAIAILASRWEINPLEYLGLPAYLIGTAGLGAWVMGHEYADGTVAGLLTLPVARRRVWTAKLAAAAPMLAALAVLARLFVPHNPGELETRAAMFVLPPIVALFVAPWLTMLTRSPLAGAVFTFAALGGSLAAGEWIGDWLYGFTSTVDAFRVAFLWWTLCGLSAIGAILGWRTFATLEVHEGHGADVELPLTLRRTAGAAGTAAVEGTAAVAGRRPLVRLIVKELRVQQLAIVVAGLWALVFVAAELSGVRQMTRSHTTEITVDVFAILQAFYSLVLPALIGSLACAEERHFGTLDSQLLLPVRSSTQWIVKSATAFGLAGLLAAVLPLVLTWTFGDHLLMAGPRNNGIALIFIVVLMVTSISLYVSTLIRSGLRALMVSIAVVYAFGLVMTRVLVSGLGRRFFQMVVLTARPAHTHYSRLMGITYVVDPLLSGLALLTILMVVLALPNFRYVARRPAIIAMHAALAIAGVIACDVLVSAIRALRF